MLLNTLPSFPLSDGVLEGRKSHSQGKRISLRVTFFLDTIPARVVLLLPTRVSSLGGTLIRGFLVEIWIWWATKFGPLLTDGLEPVSQ